MSFKEVAIVSKKELIVNIIHFQGMSKDEGINIEKKSRIKRKKSISVSVKNVTVEKCGFCN